MSVYDVCPVLKSENFTLRLVEQGDAPGLLKVYSDERAVPLFNGDNCNGDDFHYTTLERMLEAIDFTPKIGMNTFMQEFDIPFGYYNSYYSHRSNTAWEPEPINNETILQWKRQCEAEIAKRGLQFHDMGHGWTAEPFGISSTNIAR